MNNLGQNMSRDRSRETSPQHDFRQRTALYGALLVFVLICGFVLAASYLKQGVPASKIPSTLADVAASLDALPSAFKPAPEPIKVLILGDMMFDRGVRAKINANSRDSGDGFAEIFGPATTTFAGYDLVMANLEGPVSTFKSKTVLDSGKAIPGFQFTFPVGTAQALKDAGIDVVSLANNHAHNFGQAGLDQTRSALSSSSVQYFGSPENIGEIATSSCVSFADGTIVPNVIDDEKASDSLCIGFVGWHEFGTKNYKNVLDSIAKLRPTVDYLIVYPHWGVEYEHSPSALQVQLAHQWIEAGADAVIGAHPHVAQKIERYTTADGRIAPVFYSLGNFIFDQYFSFETTHGIGVEIEFDKKDGTGDTDASKYNISYKLLPFSSVGSKVSIPNASSTAKLFSIIEKVSDKDLGEWLEY